MTSLGQLVYFAAAIAFTSIAVAQPTKSAPLELKGFQVDAKVDCDRVQSLAGGETNSVKRCRNGETFMFSAEFFDGTANFTIHVSDGLIEAILVTKGEPLNGLKFDPVLQALTEKYGKPQLQKSTVTSRAGATFPQDVATWRRGSIAMVFSRHGSAVDEPALSITGQTFSINAKKSNEKAAKNL